LQLEENVEKNHLFKEHVLMQKNIAQSNVIVGTYSAALV